MQFSHLAAGSMLALFGAEVRADVLTVGPGGTFTAIQPAVDAAADGDTILVRHGTYATFSVDHKSIAIVVDPVGASVTTGKITVANLAAGQRCLLSGFHVSSATGPALSARDNVGSLRGESITNSFLSTSVPADGADIDRCRDVALTRCSLSGSAAHQVFPSQVNPGFGLVAISSNVAVYDCSLQGGAGSNGYFGDEDLPVSPTYGGYGCSIDVGQLFCSGSSIVGGNGGNGYNASCGQFHFPGGNGHPGATGLVVVSGVATILQTSITGGQGGAGGGPSASCGQPGGSSGHAGPSSTGAVSTLPGAHKSLVAATLVRELMQLDVSVSGAPGESVWLSLARDSRWSFTPTRKGVTLVGTQARSIFLGTIPASGDLQASLPIGELGAGVQSSTLFLQAACIDPAGRATLTGSDFVVLLDSMF